MRLALVTAAVLVAAPLAHAGVDIRPGDGGRLTVRADAAPLSDILDRLAKQTGMKVVYDGAPPRQLVTATLENRTPAEAVLGMLEGQGLNFAIAMDRTGLRVETLMMAGAAGPGPVPGSLPQAPPPRPQPQPHAPPPPIEPDAQEEMPPDEPVDEEQPPDEGRPLPGGVKTPADLRDEGQPHDGTAPVTPGQIPGLGSPFSQSFNPQGIQPFVPPGVQPPGFQPPGAGQPEPAPTPPPKDAQQEQ